MMPGSAPDTKEIIELLSRLKAQTPDYPVEMLATRKATFLQDVAAIKLQIKGSGGEGGQTGGASGSGSAAGGSGTASGFSFQALVAFGIVTAMLIGAFLLNDQDRDPLDKEVVLAVEETSDPAFLPLTGAAPPTTTVPTEMIPTVSTPAIPTSNQIVSNGLEVTLLDEIVESKREDRLERVKKPNPGLHLGQAEGTPAAPGQGNPWNINKPDKPEKVKPEKVKPVKPR